jgi:ribosomal protein S18 acetylase RimI-like enzyme
MAAPPRIDVDTLVFLEQHEARVHALPGRRIRDLGDAWMLHDPIDREPFWNRVNAIRWPDDGAGFDRRLAETIALFATLDRIPHVWPRPLFNEPSDLAARLIANGWEDAGGAHVMVLQDTEPNLVAARGPVPPEVHVERLGRPSGGSARRAAADVALVLSEAFAVEPGRQTAIELETLAMWDRPEVEAVLLRVDGEPAAVAKRTTFDGASYLSSIGTRPAFRGRGLGRIATAVATTDALDSGSELVYLGVFEDNPSAIGLYRSLGFEIVGKPAQDLLLR